MLNSTSKLILTTLFISIFFTACNQNAIIIPVKEASTNTTHTTINDAILSIANQLSTNNKIALTDTGTITVTSFVNLTQLNKTSQFGRVLSESLFSELFIRGFNLADFRGQNAISINNNGEFYITRNITKLQSEVSNTYILVGTYSKINENIMLNARILDNKTGKIVSSARAMYFNDDCSIFGVCGNKNRKIRLVTDNYTHNTKKTTTAKNKKILF
jgi:TolB-like protein